MDTILEWCQTIALFALAFTAWANMKTIDLLEAQISQLHDNLARATTPVGKNRIITEEMRQRLEQQARDMRPMP